MVPGGHPRAGGEPMKRGALFRNSGSNLYYFYQEWQVIKKSGVGNFSEITHEINKVLINIKLRIEIKIFAGGGRPPRRGALLAQARARLEVFDDGVLVGIPVAQRRRAQVNLPR